MQALRATKGSIKYVPSAEVSEKVLRECAHGPWDLHGNHKLHSETLAVALQVPGCLIFNTTVASLKLRPSGLETDALEAAHEEVWTHGLPLDIINKEGESVGSLMYMSAACADRWLGLSSANTHEMTVLCAGFMPVLQRHHRCTYDFLADSLRCA